MSTQPRAARRARSVMTIAVAGLAATIIGSTAAAPAASADREPGASAKPSAPAADEITHQPICPVQPEGHATCLATVAVDSAGRPLTGAGAEPAGPNDFRPFTAADVRDAYNLPSQLLGARQTIAVVGPYDHPNAAEDLAVYRAENELPACTDDFPCFRKIDQRGGTDYPTPNSSWAPSLSVGLQMTSAACPNCRLLLVEADDNTAANLGAAVDQAVKEGADVVATVYGLAEYGGAVADGVHYDHPGVPITAPSGRGFPSFGGSQLVPAAYAGVISVGGTTLYRDDNARGWSEVAWGNSGSGCSAYVARPAWQKRGLCGDKRTVADVAAVGDITTPMALYHTYGYPGWIAVGGTSVSSSLIAGVYALAGNADSITPGPHLYQHANQLFDVTSGANGWCGDSYLCTASEGYDGPTGLGTPNGIGAF